MKKCSYFEDYDYVWEPEILKAARLYADCENENEIIQILRSFVGSSMTRKIFTKVNDRCGYGSGHRYDAFLETIKNAVNRRWGYDE